MNYLNKNKSALVDRVKSPARCPEEDYKLGLSQSFASHRPSGTRSLTMGVLPSHVDLLAGTANPGQGKKKAKPPAPPSTRRLGGLAKPPTLPRRDGTHPARHRADAQHGPHGVSPQQPTLRSDLSSRRRYHFRLLLGVPLPSPSCLDNCGGGGGGCCCCLSGGWFSSAPR